MGSSETKRDRILSSIFRSVQASAKLYFEPLFSQHVAAPLTKPFIESMNSTARASAHLFFQPLVWLCRTIGILGLLATVVLIVMGGAAVSFASMPEGGEDRTAFTPAFAFITLTLLITLLVTMTFVVKQTARLKREQSDNRLWREAILQTLKTQEQFLEAASLTASTPSQIQTLELSETEKAMSNLKMLVDKMQGTPEEEIAHQVDLRSLVLLQVAAINMALPKQEREHHLQEMLQVLQEVQRCIEGTPRQSPKLKSAAKRVKNVTSVVNAFCTGDLTEFKAFLHNAAREETMQFSE